MKLATFVAALLMLALIVPSPAESQTGASSIFKVVPTPNENFNNGLQAASASSPTDIWAVGQSTIHFDGSKWTAFPAPMIKGDNTSYLGGVVDISPTLAWAGGTVGIGEANPGQVLLQWNGTEWSIFFGPNFGKGNQPSIKAMTASSANDVWAIGSLLGDDGQLLFFLFEHWDGMTWTATTALSGDAFLLGASADATNDVWAVGFNGPENDDSETLALHYNGTNWQVSPTPSLGAGANQLNGVLALAPNDVCAVGFSTSVAPPQEAPTETLIEHFDGTNWSIVPSPNVGPNSIYQSNRLFGLAANSATDLLAFGSYFAADGSGQQFTLLMHWNGTNWTILPSPNPTKASAHFIADLLYAGVVPSPGNIWIFGAEDEAPNDGTMAIHAAEGASSD